MLSSERILLSQLRHSFTIAQHICIKIAERRTRMLRVSASAFRFDLVCFGGVGVFGIWGWGWGVNVGGGGWFLEDWGLGLEVWD